MWVDQGVGRPHPCDRRRVRIVLGGRSPKPSRVGQRDVVGRLPPPLRRARARDMEGVERDADGCIRVMIPFRRFVAADHPHGVVLLRHRRRRGRAPCARPSDLMVAGLAHHLDGGLGEPDHSRRANGFGAQHPEGLNGILPPMAVSRPRSASKARRPRAAKLSSPAHGSNRRTARIDLGDVDLSIGLRDSSVAPQRRGRVPAGLRVDLIASGVANGSVRSAVAWIQAADVPRRRGRPRRPPRCPITRAAAPSGRRAGSRQQLGPQHRRDSITFSTACPG